MLKMYWQEVKRFLKDYTKFIIIGSIIISLVFGLSLTFLGGESTAVLDEDEAALENEPDVFGNDSQAAYFRFYIRHADGYVFNNSGTMYDLFSTPSMYGRVQDELGYDLISLKEEIRSEGLNDEYEPAKVTINNNSNIFTAVFDIGNNEDNMTLANYYHDYLLNDNFGPIEGNRVYSIVNPQLVVEREAQTNEIVEKVSVTPQLVLYIVFGLLSGMALTLMFALSKEFFSKKLNYAFTYIPEETDQFLIIDNEMIDKNILRHFVGTEDTIITEKTDDYELNELMNNISVKTSLMDVDPELTIDKIVLVVKAGETSRKWYKKQAELVHLLNKTVKTVQINK